MRSIALTDREKAIIKGWAAQTMSGGHWGDGDVETVDEAITLTAVDSEDAQAKLSDHMIRLILIWAEAADVETAATPEEELLLAKLRDSRKEANR